MAREYTAEELGLAPKQREYTAEELGLSSGQREFTAAELGLEQEPSKDTGIMSMMGRGLIRGAKQTGSALFDVLPAMAASAVGADEYAKKQMEEAAATQKEIEQKYGARYKSLEDVKGPGDYIPFALETMAEQGTNIATALIPGVGGGALAARGAVGLAAKEAAKRVAIGQGAGTYLGSYALNAPEIFQNIYEETGGKMEPAAALLAGSVSAALDSVLPTVLLNKLTPGVKAGVVERLLEKSGMPSDIARKVIGGAVTGAVVEGPTEAAQEAISIAAEKIMQDNPTIWGSKEFNRLIESGVRGAVGGGGFGVIGGAGQAYVQGRDQRKLNDEIKTVFKEDFEAVNKRAATEEETNKFLGAIDKAREAEQTEEIKTNEPARIDTGVSGASVSLPGEQGGGQDRIAAGTEDITQGSMDGLGEPAAAITAGKTDEPSALDQKTYSELLEIKKNYDIEQQSMLYKNGNLPRTGTKRREEYDALQTRIADLDARLKTAPGSTTQYSEADLAEIKRRENVAQEETRLREVESSLKYFEPEGVSKGYFGPGPMSRSKIIMMPIDDFLGLVKNEPETKSKQENVDKLVAEGTPFSSIPYLMLEDNVEPGVSKVVGHEGRHRARALKKAGVKELPIEIRSDSIRWSEQDDPDNKDYEKSWPTQLISENSKYPTHDYPISRDIATKKGLAWSKESPGTKPATAEVSKKEAKKTTKPRAPRKPKTKVEIDEFIDDIEYNPERLSKEDLDNLFADPKAAKDENTSPKADQVPLTDPLWKTAHPTVLRAISANDITGALKALKTTAGNFISSFADRLLGLGLTTQMGWDDVHVDLAMKSLSKVDGQKNRMLNWIKQVFPEVYNNKFDATNMKYPVYDTLQSFKELRDGKLGIPAEMFKADLEDVIYTYERTIVSLNAPGTYFTKYNAIGLSLEKGGTSTYVVTHELTHAATHWAINNPEKLNKEQQIALGKLQGLYEFAKLRTKNPGQYGYNNLHEFVAEAFSRPEFQKELRSMKAGIETNMSAWSKFIQLVARLFGIDNVLFHTLSNADILFSARSGGKVTNGPDLLWSPSRYDVKDGKFVLNPGERFKVVDNLVKNRTNWKNVDKNNVKKFFGSVGNQYRRYLLGALTIDQMADIYGTNMPQLKEYAKEVDAMIATRNAILTEGDPIITSWANLLDTNPKKAEQLGIVMIEATLKKNDPDSKGLGHDAKAYATDDSLKKAWNELTSGKDGDTAVKIYREVRDFYEKRMKEYIRVQLERIEEYGHIKGLTQKEIDSRLLKFKKDIEEKTIRPYFPIKRFGDYFLMVGKGKSKIFMQFEDAYARDDEMERQKTKLLKTGLSNADAQGLLWPGQGFNEVLNQKLSDVTQLNKINEMIDETTEGILKSTDPNVQNDQVAALQAELKDQFGQYYLEMLPSESIKKMFLHRENVAGPSQDMLRAFATSRERIAYQRARFQHMPQLFNTVEAAKLRSKTMPTTEEKAVYGDVANELAKNFKGAVLEPPKQSRLTTYLTHFGFLNFLTAPASAVVNMMAIPAIYTPVAGARYGYGNVGKALAKYTRMLGGTGYENKSNGRYEFLSLARSKLNEMPLLDKTGKPVFKTDPDGNKVAVTMADVYQHGVNRNVIDTTLTHDSVSIGEHPSQDYTGRWQKFMYYASLPFHAAEKFNREVTFMSSFDLAYDSFIKKGYTGEKAYTAALDAARDLTQETMFNYNTTNKPRYFRGDLINVLLQFKMYPQHMSVLLGRTFYKSINQNEKRELDYIREQLKNAPPEELEKALAAKKVELADMKQEATKAFWGMMGMSFLSAGATGLPIWFVFSGVMSAFQAAFGDDDEPFDVENWFKNWCNDTFGGFIGDTISRGLVSQATGMNFADRMNMNLTDMWFPDVRKSQDEVDYMQNMFINLMGPSAGALLVNYPEAIKRFNDGYTQRAFEAMMPAAIKNAMVGIRYLTEGEAKSIKGNTILEDVSPREALSQMLGFSPERVAQKQKATIEMKNANETIKNRHTDLLNAFFIALDNGDDDMLERVTDKMINFSQTNPALAFNGDTIMKSVTKRYKDRAMANITGGMGIDKKLMPQLIDMLDYGEE